MGIPWASEPYNEIIPGLWMGGTVVASEDDDQVGRFYEIGDTFDAVFTLCPTDLADVGPAAGVPHIQYRMPDGPLTQVQQRCAQELGEMVARSVCNDLKVLVRCEAGYNRSGLVVGHALIAMDSCPDRTVRLIRERRSPWALCNKDFVGYLGASGD